MWRKHFKEVFKAEENPYKGNLFMNINKNISMQDSTDYQLFTIHELNEAISRINVSKSYKRHQHWKNLISPNHVASNA